MSRRRVLVLTLFCIVVLALAVAPWTVTSGALAAAVSRQLRAVYGLDLVVKGRTTVALLPVPRLKFENVSLAAPGAVPLVEAAQMRGELRVLPLLIGNFDLTEVSLNEARARIEIEADGSTAWDLAAAYQRERIGARQTTRHIRRLVLTNSSVMISDRATAFETQLTNVNIVANWPALDGVLDLTGSVLWRDEAVQIVASGLNPATLVAGAKSRFDFDATSALGRLTLAAEASVAETFRISGRGTLATRSLRDLVQWSRVDFPLGSFIQNAGLSGDFTLDRTGLSFPAVQLTLGSDRFEGALSGRLENGRLGVTGTLATERISLSDPPSPLGPIITPAGSWSGEALRLAELSAADLDLRLSTSSARVGGLRLEDVALGLLIKNGRLELSVGRATVNRGLVKGRLVLSQPGSSQDLKLQGSFDRVDMGGFLSDLGQSRWLSGTGQGQILLDATGDSPAELVRQAQGRATILIRQGDLWGVSLNEALRRAERRPLSTTLEWKGGRTPFEQALIVANVHAGAGDIVEGHVAAPPTRTALQGRILLPERTLAVKALVEAVGASGAGAAASPAPSLAFDISGPWSDVTVAPDVQSLIQRSRAARQLLNPEPRGEDVEEPRAAPNPGAN